MDKFKKAMLPIITFARIDIKRLFRDKVAIFFTFFFPLVFLLIFGTIFSSNTSLSFRVSLLNESRTSFAKDFEKQLRKNDMFKVDDEATTLPLAKEKMQRGQLEATIILPEDFGAVQGEGHPTGVAKIVYDQNNQDAASSLASIMDSIFVDVNNKLVPYEPPFTTATESTATKGLTQFDYTFSGLLGFVVLSLGIFGPTQVFPRLKQRGVLRRYRTTTLKVWQYFLANVVSNAFVGILSAIVMFVTAVAMFDLNMRGNYLLLAMVIILGTVMLFGIGLAIGGWAKNENQAAPISQLVTLPMMFLSGVFFPTFIMPELLQKVTQFIPLTSVVDSIRLIVTENAGLAQLAPELGIMAAWTLIIYVIAFRLFRWE